MYALILGHDNFFLWVYSTAHSILISLMLLLCRKLTICDCLERCLRKGKGDEQAAAAMCAVLMVIQLGASEEREEVFKIFLPILKVIVSDSSASAVARSHVCSRSVAGRFFGHNCMLLPNKILFCLFI